MKKVTIYTDGACSGNPGPGGYGAILMYGDIKKEISGGFLLTTNNRMEILAVIKALELLKEPCEVSVYTDSRYVSDSIVKGWVYNWEKNNWMKKDKSEALNKDLWKKLLELLRIHKVSFFWVKGHNSNPYNERCDFLATEAIKNKELLEDLGYTNTL